jgi:nucleoside-diphosphate-sugar epimerase
MEQLVSGHDKFLIVRLPQVAGRTPNPHTLLNYLYARVSRSERVTVWTHATRNIIDIDDAVAIVVELIRDVNLRRTTVNVANPLNYSVLDIVAMMEKVVGKKAVTEMVERGAPYSIDTSVIASIVRNLKLQFDDRYLERVLRKYYGQPNFL